MFRNYIQQSKCILIIDNINIQRISHKLVSTWVSPPSASIATILPAISDPFNPTLRDFSPEILDCSTEPNVLLPIAELSQYYKASAIFRLLQAYKKNPKVKQIFVWASVKQIFDDVLVPCLDHMATSIITFKDSVNLSVLTKKSGGSVMKMFFSYEFKGDELNVRKVTKEVAVKTMEPKVNPESLATFRINFDEEELEARNALKLPYERTSDNMKGDGRIIYSPDSDDDFDEEDPDDDLNI